MSKQAWTSTLTKYSFGLSQERLVDEFIYPFPMLGSETHRLFLESRGNRNLNALSLGYNSLELHTEAPRSLGCVC